MIVEQLRRAFDLSGVSVLAESDSTPQVLASTGDAPATVGDADLVAPLASGFVVAARGAALTADDHRILRAFLAELSLAFEQQRLRRIAAEADALTRADELRTAMLRAVSHDLRSPLANIKASVSSLRQTDVDWPADVRRDFLAAIEDDTDRLTTIVTNLLDLGRLEAILPPAERVPGERYEHGTRIKCLVVSVRKGMRGPQVTLSRSHPHLVRKLFALEVPEIADGTVEIAGIAREAGHRTKIAVHSTVQGVNAKGACIGPMGQRVRNVMSELGGEKIDIVDWSDDPATLVAHALSPAQVQSVTVVDAAAKSARVVVPDFQLSLAIGKEGQNARLAARLTGWRIDIHSDEEA